MRHPDYPFWSFISFVLVLLPAPWHWRARNIATICLICWLALANLLSFINTIIWADNYRNISPIWCDISSHILAAITYAVPCCSLAQMRRLESVASTKQSVISSRERSRRLWGEAALCLGLPIIMIALHITYQGHRFDIFENIGCTIPSYQNWVRIILSYVVPMILSLASLVYASLAMRWFLKRRIQFRTILATSDSGLTVGRYLRLIALCVSDAVILISATMFAVGAGISLTAQAQGSNALEDIGHIQWSFIHEDFGFISQYPEDTENSLLYYANAVAFYVGPIYSIVFFSFFGFGEEAVAEYTRVVQSFIRLLSQFGLWRKHIPNTHISQRPTLGSKVVSVSENEISAARTFPQIGDSGSEKLFDGVEDTASVRSPMRGIPVVIERSVV